MRMLVAEHLRGQRQHRKADHGVLLADLVAQVRGVADGEVQVLRTELRQTGDLEELAPLREQRLGLGASGDEEKKGKRKLM